jgi:hypothetical protein
VERFVAEKKGGKAKPLTGKVSIFSLGKAFRGLGVRYRLRGPSPYTSQKNVAGGHASGGIALDSLHGCLGNGASGAAV